MDMNKGDVAGFRDFMVMSWGFDQENGDMSG